MFVLWWNSTQLCCGEASSEVKFIASIQYYKIIRDKLQYIVLNVYLQMSVSEFTLK